MFHRRREQEAFYLSAYVSPRLAAPPFIDSSYAPFCVVFLAAIKHLLLVLAVAGVCALLSGCDNSPLSFRNDDNRLPITVGKGLDASPDALFDINIPTVSLVVCLPGNASLCRRIDHILLDTGSSGLRIFRNVLPFDPPPLSWEGRSVYECLPFGTANLWGQLGAIDVRLGREPFLRSLPVQIMGRNPVRSLQHILPPTCAQKVPDRPEETFAGFNGILGIAPQRYDFGFDYLCEKSHCSLWAPSVPFQVPNPVMLLPEDNNGVVLSFPRTPSNGNGPISGELRFGIWTQADNRIPSASTTYFLDGTGSLRALSGLSRIPVRIDSGTNFSLMPSSYWRFPSCPQPISSFACPPEPTVFPLLIQGDSGPSMGLVALSVRDARVILEKNSSVLPGILYKGKDSPFPMIELGLPFFLGRTIYVQYSDGLRKAGISLPE